MAGDGTETILLLDASSGDALRNFDDAIYKTHCTQMIATFYLVYYLP